MEVVRDPDTASTDNGHEECLMCGYRNPWSLGMRFDRLECDGVHGRFQGGPRLQGYQGILHGGVIAALLDSAMAHCLFHRGVRGVTGDLHVRYLEPVSCDAWLDVVARLRSAAAPLYYLRAEILRDGRVMAWGEATFVRKPAAPGEGETAASGESGPKRS